MVSYNDEVTKIIAAVDFGTTFSSVALALSTNSATQEVISRWEGQGQTSVNVPTVLQYRGSVSSGRVPNKWGFEATTDVDDAYYKRYELFKLQLYNNLQDMALSGDLLAHHVNSRDCKKLVTDYLKALHASLMQHIQGVYPRSLLTRNEHLDCIVTVPAIWSPMDKNITRTCAIEAGLGTDDTIRIIKEPEAASLYALDTMRDSNLHLNDTFVICDAGGGTVDLMSYTVAALPPYPHLDEAASGTGGLCGGTFVNLAFETWLDRRFRYQPSFTPEVKANIMEQFEDNLKKRFNGMQAEPYTMVIRGLRGDDSLRHLGIDRSRFTIPTHDLTDVFRQVTDKIVRLVQNQIAATLPAVVSTVLLAGGFGQSKFLHGELERSSPRVKVHHIPNSDTAVVRGALLQGLKRANPDLPYAVIECKIPEMSYGIGRWTPYDARRHDASERNPDAYTQAYRVQEILWFMIKGVRQYESEPIEVDLETRTIDDGGPLQPMTLEIYQCRLEDPPIHKSRDVRNLMAVTAKLDQIPVRKLTATKGKDHCRWHSVRFKFEVTIGQAGLLNFSVKHDQRSYGEGSVEVKFRD